MKDGNNGTRLTSFTFIITTETSQNIPIYFWKEGYEL